MIWAGLSQGGKTALDFLKENKDRRLPINDARQILALFTVGCWSNRMFQ